MSSCTPRRENHLTPVLWENFAILEARDWCPALLRDSGLGDVSAPVVACQWSYGWESRRPNGAGGGPGKRICDVVVHCRLANGRERLLVVEAKNLGCELGEKDRDPGYYLDLPAFAEHPDRALIYLVDDTVASGVMARVVRGNHVVGLLTWQRLAAIQIWAAGWLEVPSELRAFIASALWQQYVAHGIIPPVPPLPYLASEPSMEDVDLAPSALRQQQAEREAPLWRPDPPADCIPAGL